MGFFPLHLGLCLKAPLNIIRVLHKIERAEVQCQLLRKGMKCPLVQVIHKLDLPTAEAQEVQGLGHYMVRFGQSLLAGKEPVCLGILKGGNSGEEGFSESAVYLSISFSQKLNSHFATSLMPLCIELNNVTQRRPCPCPKTCDYVTLHGKRT